MKRRGDHVALDLGLADVHQPSADMHVRKPMAYTYECDGKTFECDDGEDATEMISSEVCKSLPASEFALPSQRKYPIDTAARTRNAAARLAQQKKAGNVSDADYAIAHANIEKAEKKFGIADGEGDEMTATATLRLDAVGIKLDAKEPEKGVWIQLAKPGKFVKDGKTFEFNQKVFREIVGNFSQEVPVDYEHASHADPGSPGIAIHGAPAQGWIKKLRVDKDGLYGLVEWGQQARDQIRAGQYRYFSPVVAFGSKSRTTGEDIGACLLSGACTNVPFLSHMKPLAAKHDALVDRELAGKLAHSPAEYMPQIKSILRLPELATSEECSSQVARLRLHVEKHDGDLEMTNDGVSLADYVVPLRDLVGAKLGTSIGDVLDVVTSLIAATDKHEFGAAGSSTRTNGEEVAEETDNMDAKLLADLTAKNSEISVSLKDAEVKLTASEAKAKDAEAKIATLTLDLKEAVSAKETVAAELVQLRAWKTEREVKDFDARIAEAFDHYKDQKHLTEIDRESMRVELKHAPETFEKRYPKIPPGRAHLTQNLTGKREAPAPEVGAPGTVKLSHHEVVRQIAFERGISIGDAQLVVAKMRRSQQNTDG